MASSTDESLSNNMVDAGGNEHFLTQPTSILVDESSNDAIHNEQQAMKIPEKNPEIQHDTTQKKSDTRNLDHESGHGTQDCKIENAPQKIIIPTITSQNNNLIEAKALNSNNIDNHQVMVDDISSLEEKDVVPPLANTDATSQRVCADPDGLMPPQRDSQRFSEMDLQFFSESDERYANSKKASRCPPGAPPNLADKFANKSNKTAKSEQQTTIDTATGRNSVTSRSHSHSRSQSLSDGSSSISIEIPLDDAIGESHMMMPRNEPFNVPPRGMSPVDDPPSIIAGQQQQIPTAARPTLDVTDVTGFNQIKVSDNFHAIIPPAAGRITPAPAYSGYPVHSMPHAMSAMAAPQPPSVIYSNGKRKIHLRLEEEIQQNDRRSSFLSFRRRATRSQMSASNLGSIDPVEPSVADRGRMTVSWFDGTSSLELQEHVRSSVIRKLRLQGSLKLRDFRLLDENVDPPEEIVLSPFIPSGSHFLLRFSTKNAEDDYTPSDPRYRAYGAPESPSAAPSPHPAMSDLSKIGLNPNQLALLGAKLKDLQMPTPSELDGTASTPIVKSRTLPASAMQESKYPQKKGEETNGQKLVTDAGEATKSEENDILPFGNSLDVKAKDDDSQSKSSTIDMATLQPEDQIQSQLTQITQLLLAERQQRYVVPRRQEKRQVVFVLANYFVLFLSLIFISAEIQARAPQWQSWLETQLTNVQNCSADRDALFECVSNGDFAGLIASVILWISRSAATKRIFLFGFETPKKLWTVVYESLVTAVCWGFSYLFIRRGMNPDTSRNVLQKYWKDAIYGSLAGFNASFLKSVLKNLIPQEAIEDALQERQLKILSWLPSFAH